MIRMPIQGLGLSAGGRSILEASIDDITAMLERQPDPDYAALVLARLYDGDTIARILNSPKITPDKAAAILNSTNMSVDTAATILNSASISVDKAAAILNSVYIAVDRAASILNSPKITPDKAAAILNSTNMSVDRAASILSSSNISTSRIANIFASVNFSAVKIKDIVRSSSWTRPTVFKELMLDDPVAAGRATYRETNSNFSFVYDATNRYGELTFPSGIELSSGNYAELDFGSVSLQPGDVVVFVRRHTRSPSIGGWWYVKLLVGGTEIFSRDIGPDSYDTEYRHIITISSVLTGNLIWRLHLGATIYSYTMSDALEVLLVLR